MPSLGPRLTQDEIINVVAYVRLLAQQARHENPQRGFMPQPRTMKKFLGEWKQRVRELKTQVYALYLAYQDPRVPWYAKVFTALVVGYAFSPIDLIPDFIPILGYVDDLVLVPLGIALAIRMIPTDVLAEAQAKAREVLVKGKPVNRAAAIAIVIIWLLLAGLTIRFLVGFAR